MTIFINSLAGRMPGKTILNPRGMHRAQLVVHHDRHRTVHNIQQASVEPLASVSAVGVSQAVGKSAPHPNVPC